MNFVELKGLKAIPFPNIPDEGYNRNVQKHPGNSLIPSFLKNLKQDDIILIVVIILLLTDSNFDDKLLVGVLVFLFIAGLEGNFLGL